MAEPIIKAFFDPATYTISYVVHGKDNLDCAIVDPVLDFDPRSARTSVESAERIVEYVQQQKLTVQWILETHAHADHLSAAQWLKQQLGGKVAIGKHIDLVQRHFAKLYGLEDSFAVDGSQFDHLFEEAEKFNIGDLSAEVLYTPGHTPACISYKIEDAVFVGDTLFMPDYGTARADFPGGNAETLYDSIQKLYSLPDETRLFMCHDYQPDGREPLWQTTVAEQKEANIMLDQGVARDDFVQKRRQRDATLKAPKLILPSLQVNIRGGDLPPQDSNGTRYLRIPLNRI